MLLVSCIANSIKRTTHWGFRVLHKQQYLPGYLFNVIVRLRHAAITSPPFSLHLFKSPLSAHPTTAAVETCFETCLVKKTTFIFSRRWILGSFCACLMQLPLSLCLPLSLSLFRCEKKKSLGMRSDASIEWISMQKTLLLRRVWDSWIHCRNRHQKTRHAIVQSRIKFQLGFKLD